MSVETVVVAVVLGNLFCATLGFVAGRSFGALGLDLELAQEKAAKAEAILADAKAKADADRAALSDAAASGSPEDGIAALINEGRDA